MGQIGNRGNWSSSVYSNQLYGDGERRATKALQESFIADEHQFGWDQNTQELFEIL